MEETGSRMVGGGFHKQGSSPTSLILGCKTRSPHSLVRILTVDTEALLGSITWIFQMVSTTSSSLKATDLEWLLVQEEWAVCTFQGQGRVRGLQLPRSSCGLNQWPHPLNDLFQQCATDSHLTYQPHVWGNTIILRRKK